jgi:hypothetical protein
LSSGTVLGTLGLNKVDFFFFEVLGIELRTLLYRLSHTPSPFDFSLFLDRVLSFCLGCPGTATLCLAENTDTYHHTWSAGLNLKMVRLSEGEWWWQYHCNSLVTLVSVGSGGRSWHTGGTQEESWFSGRSGGRLPRGCIFRA